MEDGVQRLKAQGSLGKLVKDFWGNIIRAPQEGRLVAWSSPTYPTDILRIMGFDVVVLDNYSVNGATSGMGVQLCETAEEYGCSQDLCSYARINLELPLAGENSKSPLKLPKPDLIVADSQCHTRQKWAEALSRLYDVPLMTIHIPVMHDDLSKETRDSAQRYVVKQLHENITFLEGFTKKRMDYDKLAEGIGYSSEQSRLWWEVQSLGKTIPSPISAVDSLFLFAPLVLLRGQKAGVTFYEDLREEVATRVQQGIGAVPKEDYRLHFHFGPPWYRLTKLADMFISRNACLVTLMYPMVFDWRKYDPARPIDSIAEAHLSNLVNVGFDQRLKPVLQMIEDYKLDGVIAPRLGSCSMRTFFFDLMEEIEAKAGVPCVSFDSDLADSRMYSDEQVDRNIDAFFEILANRRQSG